LIELDSFIFSTNNPEEHLIPELISVRMKTSSTPDCSTVRTLGIALGLILVVSINPGGGHSVRLNPSTVAIITSELAWIGLDFLHCSA
jgi:hypothetical protein